MLRQTLIRAVFLGVLAAADVGGTTAVAQVSLAPIPYREEKQVQESTSRAMIASALLLVIVGAILFAFKKRLPGLPRLPHLPDNLAGQSGIRVIDSSRLGTSARLWVIEFEGERLLLAQSGNQVTLLTTRPAPVSAPIPEMGR